MKSVDNIAKSKANTAWLYLVDRGVGYDARGQVLKGVDDYIQDNVMNMKTILQSDLNENN